MLTLDLIQLFSGLWFKPMIWLLIFLSIVKRGHHFSAAASHNFLLSGFMAMMLGVLIHFSFPGIALEILPVSVQAWENYSAYLSLQAVHRLENLPLLFLLLYLFGFVWICCYQCLAVVEVFKLVRRCSPVKDKKILRMFAKINSEWSIINKVRVLQSAELTSPVVFGFIKPILILPNNYQAWSSARLNRILVHEISHVQRKDWLTNISLFFFCACFWFVPFAWIALKKIAWYAEICCDDAVVDAFDCRAEYAEDLLEVESDTIHNAWLVNLNKQSGLFSRIDHVLDSRYIRQAQSVKARVAYFLVCFVLVLPLAVVKAVPITHPLTPAKQFVLDYRELDKKSAVEISGFNSVSAYEAFRHLTDLKPLLLDRSTVDQYHEEMLITLDPGQHHSVVEDDRLDGAQNNENNVMPTDLNSSTPSLAVPDLVVKGFIPQYMKNPVYPRKALLQGLEGTVQVEFDIAINGSIENSQVVYSEPQGVFDASVLQALEKSRYTPMYIGQEPVRTKNVTQTYIFHLQERY